MNQQPDLSFVAALTFVFGLAFSPQVAAVVGPYAVIFIAAVGGASIRLGQIGARPRAASFWLIFYSTLIAMMATVPLSTWGASKVEGLSGQGLFGFVSLVLGYVGDRWPSLLNWVIGLFKSTVEAVVSRWGKQ